MKAKSTYLKANPMTRYACLLRFTDKGACALQKTTARAAEFRKAAKKVGVTVSAQLWTAGGYDGLLILNGDEGKVLRCLAQLAAQGNVRTETLRAFDEKEINYIVG
jgi:uncharacterized protein with GYD domain